MTFTWRHVKSSNQLWQSGSSGDALPLKMAPIYSTETSVTIYQPKLRNIPEEWTTQLESNESWNLASRCLFNYYVSSHSYWSSEKNYLAFKVDFSMLNRSSSSLPHPVSFTIKFALPKDITLPMKLVNFRENKTAKISLHVLITIPGLGLLQSAADENF